MFYDLNGNHKYGHATVKNNSECPFDIIISYKKLIATVKCGSVSKG